MDGRERELKEFGPYADSAWLDGKLNRLEEQLRPFLRDYLRFLVLRELERQRRSR